MARLLLHEMRKALDGRYTRCQTITPDLRASSYTAMDKIIDSNLVLEQNSLKIDNRLSEVITYFIFQLSIIKK